MIIYYSRITRHYYVPSPTGDVATFTRKDEAERCARKYGATEIEHRRRNAAADLRHIGFAPDSAKRIAKEFFS